MPEYKFNDNQSSTKTGTNLPVNTVEHADSTQPRTIPVQDGLVTFHLGAEKTARIPEEVTEKTTNQPPIAVQKSSPTSVENLIKKAKSRKATGRVVYKVWHALEFVAATAVIFMMLFFAVNFDSYNQLFLTKLDQLRGGINQNPYNTQEANQLRNASSSGQKPLPIVNNSQSAKKQIPALSMAIAPPDDRILVPRISQNVPIVRVPTDMLIRKDWGALEKQIQEALRHGVVHFPGTAFPGEPGNIVLTGHSSYFPWDPGRFKDVFALLHQVNVGDKVIVYHEQKKYEYQIYEKKVVKPSQVDVLTQKGESRLTLITCTPVGTDLNRLVLLAKLISTK
jgi:sortase A